MFVPQKIVDARKKKGLTQEELAHLTNITVRTIQRIESGETTPRSYTLKAIAAALDTTFEEQHATETDQPEPATANIDAPAVNTREDTQDFLQMLCLSCFSYLVLPFIHFLIPIYLFKKRKEQNPQVVAYVREVIKIQVFWVVALNLLLLLTAAFKIVSAAYFDSSYSIHYQVPFL